MLHIDRVTAELDVLPRRPDPSSPATALAMGGPSREKLAELIRDVLREELRGLERQGAI